MSQAQVEPTREQLAAQERRVAATARQLSESVRETPFGQLLARVGADADYSEALAAFVQEQWDLHNAMKEMGHNPKRGREESASQESAAAEE
jgi:hypothetical protein